MACGAPQTISKWGVEITGQPSSKAATIAHDGNIFKTGVIPVGCFSPSHAKLSSHVNIFFPICTSSIVGTSILPDDR